MNQSESALGGSEAGGGQEVDVLRELTLTSFLCLLWASFGKYTGLELKAHILFEYHVTCTCKIRSSKKS